MTSQTADGREIQLQDAADLAPLAHVVSHDEEYGGECGQRNIAGQRRGDEQDDEQRERMDHAGDRRARAGTDIGCGAGDGAGGGNAAEERRGDVGDSLGNEFDIGVVAIAGHAVGDDGGEHAFQRGKHRDGKCRRNQWQDVLGVEVGNGEGRESARNSAEASADGFDRKMKPGTLPRCKRAARRSMRARAW